MIVLPDMKTVGPLLALAFSLAPLQASPSSSQATAAARDSYALVRGNSTTISGSLDELHALRSANPGDFLWARRSGVRYIVRDPELLEEAAACFDVLRELEPEQAALERQQAQLDREEQGLDREQEQLESESEQTEDEDTDTSAGQGPVPRFEEAQRELEARQADLASRQRELEAVERDLDRREEALDKQAEASLWKLIDRAIRDGAATPISR